MRDIVLKRGEGGLHAGEGHVSVVRRGGGRLFLRDDLAEVTAQVARGVGAVAADHTAGLLFLGGGGSLPSG